MDGRSFQDATAAAYDRIRASLDRRHDRHLVRMWNFIPGILEPIDAFPQRYMAFNAGRFAALGVSTDGCTRSGGPVPTSSGVGSEGPDLVIHALSCDVPGLPVENRRQVPSYRYSARFGPRPPCFARGTRLAWPSAGDILLLVGGTASVVGEETAHAGNPGAQIDETLSNLSALLRDGLPGVGESSAPRAPLGFFRFLRIYYLGEDIRPVAERTVAARFGGVHEVEYIPATLCRPDLLVEIEGVACLRPLSDLGASH
jgi:chorismate lyase/3-hydroxybenzoate synthase